jgi:AP endonuclease-2
MRIVCWNCNGLRTLRQYRPWYALKDWKECLDNLGADIICFQEAKITKKDLIANHRDMCLPVGYEAYYSLHPIKGYSGVVTFAKSDVVQAQKAEMGLTGELVPDRRDAASSIGGYPDEKAVESPLYDVIDAEGRAIVTDFGLFVLVSADIEGPINASTFHC